MSQPCSSLPHRQSSEFSSCINPSSPNRAWAKFPAWWVHQSCHWLHSVLEQDLKFVWFLLVNDTRKWVRSSVMLSLKNILFSMSWHNLMAILQITFISGNLPFFLCPSLTCHTIFLHELIFFFQGALPWVFQVEFYIKFLASIFPVCPFVLFLFPLRWLLHPWYVLTKMSFIVPLSF